jgi:UDP-N-acetyl-D-glucosamine dehydrogenase
LILGGRHEEYLKLDPAKAVKSAGRPFAVVDCFCVLDDDKIRRYLELGCEVKGMGRGHIKRIKDSLDSRRGARKAG